MTKTNEEVVADWYLTLDSHDWVKIVERGDYVVVACSCGEESHEMHPWASLGPWWDAHRADVKRALGGR